MSRGRVPRRTRELRLAPCRIPRGLGAGLGGTAPVLGSLGALDPGTPRLGLRRPPGVGTPV